MERSLQQAKLQRQNKTQDDPDDTEATQQASHSTPDTASPSPKQDKSNGIELKSLPRKEDSPVNPKTTNKPAPIETNLDEPYFPESDTVALIDKREVEIIPLQLATEEESVILSSDEESTLLEK